MLLVCLCVQATEHNGLFRKRCKANCTFSAEKYTWFTVWKLPPLPPQQFHVFTTIKTKRNIKDQSSSPPPTHGSFKTPLRSVSILSEHFHRYWMSLLSSMLHPCTQREGSVTKATVPTGSSSSCYKIPDRQRWIARKWHPKQWSSPSALSLHRGKASCDRPSSVFSPSPRAGRIYVQSVSPLWCIMAKSLFTGSLHRHP